MWQLVDVLIHPAAHLPRRADDVLLADAQHVDDRGVLAVDPGVEIALLEIVADRGDVAKAQLAAVGKGADHDVAVFLTAVHLPLGAQHDLAGIGADGAARQVEGGLGDGAGHLIEGEAVLAQGVFGNLDGNLQRPQVFDVDGGNLAEIDKVVADVFGNLLEKVVVAIRNKGDGHHIAAAAEGAHDGFFGFGREGGDRVNLGLDIVERAVEVGVAHEFHGGVAAAFPGRGGQPLDTFGAFERFFNPQADTGFRLLRGGAEIGHADLDDADVDIGEFLLVQVEIGDHAAGEENPHQQVGCDGILDKPTDGRAHDFPPPRRLDDFPHGLDRHAVNHRLDR